MGQAQVIGLLSCTLVTGEHEAKTRSIGEGARRYVRVAQAQAIGLLACTLAAVECE